MSIKKNDPNSKSNNRKKKTYKFIKKGKGNEPTVIEFNLSKAVILLIVIGVIIATITTVSVIRTIMRAKENKALANNEEDEHVIWVESTSVDSSGNTVVDKDESGNPIKVPVPKGYSASKIPGETSANTGFVIYEGDIDWNTILIGTTNENGIDTQSDVNEEITSNETPTQTDEENTSNAIMNNENVSIDDSISENNEASINGEMMQSDETNQQQNNEANSNDSIAEENVINNEDTTLSETEEMENTNDLNNEATNIENEVEADTNSTEENAGETNINIEEITNQESESDSEQNTTENSNAENGIEENTSEIIEESSQTETQNIQIQDTQAQVLADETTDANNTSVEPRATTEEINIFNLQKSVNQYVWVPVKDVTRIYGVDSDGKLWGKLYNYSSSSGKTQNNWSEENGIMSITSSTSYREPDVTRYNRDYDIDSALQSSLKGKNRYELLSKELEENFYLTIKSIKEYGGFYIGRYETGGLSGTAVVRKMEEDIDSQTGYTMYEKARTLEGENSHVMTSIIWGSLWDETMEWLVESGATTSDGTVLTYEFIGNNSTIFGNYWNSTLNYIPSGSEIPEETAEKTENNMTKIPTGSSEYTKVNNIYDLAGNVYELTLEANSTIYRVSRGGFFAFGGGYSPAANRYDFDPTGSGNVDGSRSALFIR